MEPQQKFPHIGNLISQQLLKRNMKVAALARRMGLPEPTVRNILKRKNVSVFHLWEASNALEHNFFADLERNLPATYATVLPTDVRATQLEEELKMVKRERDLLANILSPK